MMSYTVVIKQAGGKYGVFTCPQCGGGCDYKFTSSSGWCGKCGAQYMLTDEGTITDLFKPTV